VPADPNGREVKGGGLTNTRSAGKANRHCVTILQKVRPYRQSTKEIVHYQRGVPSGTTTLLID